MRCSAGNTTLDLDKLQLRLFYDFDQCETWDVSFQGNYYYYFLSADCFHSIRGSILPGSE